MAQLVERMAVNHKVRGSNPRGGVGAVLVHTTLGIEIS
jgi:hypothetical protein